jgi:hypothetical protein
MVRSDCAPCSDQPASDGRWREIGIIHQAVLGVALIAAAALPVTAQALMSGIAPDSPDARVDRGGARSPFAGVGALNVVHMTGTGIFTATAIDRRYVLTAAHVVAHATPERVSFEVNAGTPSERRIAAEAIFVHPGYRGFRGDVAHFDVAVVRLAEALPGTTPVFPLYRWPLAPGSTLILAGYGASGTGDGGATVKPDARTRRLGLNAADEFAAGPGGRLEIYLFDFDGPDLDTNRMGGPTLGNHLETTVAGGDSGSPAFVRIRGRLFLAGVNTFQAGVRNGPPAPRFGSVGGGMLVSTFADWIEGVIAAPR